MLGLLKLASGQLYEGQFTNGVYEGKGIDDFGNAICFKKKE